MDLTCENCGRPEGETAMVFKLERWCSENCRKALERQTTATVERSEEQP